MQQTACKKFLSQPKSNSSSGRRVACCVWTCCAPADSSMALLQTMVEPLLSIDQPEHCHCRPLSPDFDPLAGHGDEAQSSTTRNSVIHTAGSRTANIPLTFRLWSSGGDCYGLWSRVRREETVLDARLQWNGLVCWWTACGRHEGIPQMP